MRVVPKLRPLIPTTEGAESGSGISQPIHFVLKISASLIWGLINFGIVNSEWRMLIFRGPEPGLHDLLPSVLIQKTEETFYLTGTRSCVHVDALLLLFAGTDRIREIGYENAPFTHCLGGEGPLGARAVRMRPCAQILWFDHSGGLCLSCLDYDGYSCLPRWNRAAGGSLRR